MSEPHKPSDALEVIVDGYKRIIVFSDEGVFKAFLKANTHLEPIYGTREYEKRLFPGLFVAAIKNGEL